jgi:hypothetical protein
VLRLAFRWRKSRRRVTGAIIGTHRPYRAGRASIVRGEGEEMNGRERKMESMPSILHDPGRGGDQIEMDLLVSPISSSRRSL